MMLFPGASFAPSKELAEALYYKEAQYFAVHSHAENVSAKSNNQNGENDKDFTKQCEDSRNLFECTYYNGPPYADVVKHGRGILEDYLPHEIVDLVLQYAAPISIYLKQKLLNSTHIVIIDWPYPSGSCGLRLFNKNPAGPRCARKPVVRFTELTMNNRDDLHMCELHAAAHFLYWMQRMNA